MNHFFRSIVLFVSFVAIWNCYAKIESGLPYNDCGLKGVSMPTYKREIVFDKIPSFPDGITFQQDASEYSVINTTDIPLYFGTKSDTRPRSYQNLPDILPEDFEPSIKLVSSKIYSLAFAGNGREAGSWHEKIPNYCGRGFFSHFGLIKFPTEDILNHQVPEDINFSIPFYYNGQKSEMTGHVEYFPTLQHYYNYFEYLRSKPESGFLFLVVIGIFSIFLVIKTMRYFLRN